MEIFDIIDENGNPTGKTVTREKAHTDGIPHRTAHIWIIRKKDGRVQVLLQKRSMNKDSFPGKFDTSSAGIYRSVMSRRNLQSVNCMRNWESRLHRISWNLRELFQSPSKKNFMEKCFAMKKLHLYISMISR